MKIPVDVLRAAWIAGVLEKRSFVPKNALERKVWKTPEELWNEASQEYAQSMEACARVIEDFIMGSGKKK